ncbi:recombinase family protein [Pseudoflavonifractor sp. HCP28S3_F10]|uniref:recombinase family protein n=1 Tax=Pseudoflavonifractor sp. HCP28S3_F10 TaxID=3438947 RepID=UPI003F8CE9EB
MQKCCLYCRVDGPPIESNHIAMEHQRTELRRLADQLGFDVSTEMLQYESGLDANRQSIKTLIRDARHGVYNRVLVMNSGRLTRDPEGLAMIGEKLTAAGVRVYCPDGEIDLAPAYSHGYCRVATMEQTM